MGRRFPGAAGGGGGGGGTATVGEFNEFRIYRKAGTYTWTKQSNLKEAVELSVCLGRWQER